MVRLNSYESYCYELGFEFGLKNKTILNRPIRGEADPYFILGYNNAKGV